jgi:hypothetical protein
MAEVQNVEAAVRDDEFFAGGAEFFPPIRQFFPNDDFVAEVHGAIFIQPPPIGNVGIYDLRSTRAWPICS